MKIKSLIKLITLSLAITTASVHAEKLTIAVISDTQNYTDVTLPQPQGINTFIQQMQYLVDTKEDKNLIFATHVGDVVQHGDGQFQTGIKGKYTLWDTQTEWDYANLAMTILTDANIPFSVVPGNHDYDNYSWYSNNNGPGSNRPLKGATMWNHYFGSKSSHFKDKSWYGGGGAYGFDMNSFQIIEQNGFKFLHLGLQMEPTPDDLAWAQRVLNNHSSLPVIITTHEWLEPTFDSSSPRADGYDAYFKGTNHLSPNKVWDEFIRKNENIFMVLSGHAWTPTLEGRSNGESLRIDNNDSGYPVYQLLQDYQGNTIGLDGKPNSAIGGAGWLRFIEFDTDTQKIHFYTYSTLLDKYAGRDGTNYFDTPASYSDFVLDFPPQLIKALEANK